jgi:hypothetical protein
MGLIDKISSPPAHCEYLLEVFRLVIPNENNLPESFYKINKSFYKSKVVEFKLCSVCEKRLNTKNKCPSESCLSNHCIHSFKPIKVFILDIKKQITFILENNYTSILNNLGNLKKMCFFTFISY